MVNSREARKGAKVKGKGETGASEVCFIPLTCSVLLKISVIKNQNFLFLLTFNFQYVADRTFVKSNKN